MSRASVAVAAEAPDFARAPQWQKHVPTVEDLQGRGEAYFWVRGGNFNRPLIVCAYNGVTSEKVDGTRKYRAELNFTFYAEHYPDHIWASELSRWPALTSLEWAGPIPQPLERVAFGGDEE